MTAPAGLPPDRPRVRIRRLVKITAFVLGTWYLARPQVGRAERALNLADTVDAMALVVGGLLAALAILTYAQLTRTLLGKGNRPGFWHMVAIVMSSLGVNRIVPAGTAVGGVVTFRLLARAGVERARAATTLSVQGLGSAIVLLAMLWVGVLVVLPSHGAAPGYSAAAISGAALVIFAGFLGAALRYHHRWLWALAERAGARHERLRIADLTGWLDRSSAWFVELSHQPRRYGAALLWGSLNWLLDIASLWVFLRAFGAGSSPLAVLVAFGVANIVAAIPLTPGGLGVVELTMAASLVAFGSPPEATALGIAAYRIVNYWLPIPGAAAAYLALRLTTTDLRSIDDRPAPTPVTHLSPTSES
jgi:uncharacterized protein (TIRG00374 family)